MVHMKCHSANVPQTSSEGASIHATEFKERSLLHSEWSYTTVGCYSQAKLELLLSGLTFNRTTDRSSLVR